MLCWSSSFVVAKPTFFLIHQNLPACLLWRPNLLPLQRHPHCHVWQISWPQTSVSERNLSSALDSLSRVQLSWQYRDSSSSSSSSSLYSRPSLAEMKSMRMENRAWAYEFLHGIRIVLDELDRLDLPITVHLEGEEEVTGSAAGGSTVGGG